MAKHCTICGSAENTRIAREMIAAGATDAAIGKAVGIGRMSVYRHRTACVLRPAKILAEAAGKGREVTEQRAQVLAAAEAGDPAAFVTFSAIVSDLKAVHERLERTAGAAENDKQRLAVASLSAQQLRASEVRAKIGGVGGYATQKAVGAGEGARFNLVMNFSGGRTTQISATVVDPATVPPAGQTIGGMFSMPTLGRTVDVPDLVEADDGGAEFDEDV